MPSLRFDHAGCAGAAGVEEIRWRVTHWPFIGAAEAGERGAILYTIVEACRRRGINPYDDLRGVLTRLPKKCQQDIASVTTARSQGALATARTPCRAQPCRDLSAGITKRSHR